MWANGLGMLVAQAKAASERFSGKLIPDWRVSEITHEMERETRNLVLIGMPGCGKTTVGKALADRLGRKLVDTDDLIVERAGCSIPEIFANQGEEAFRQLEHQVLCDVSKQSGLIIATGGGVVTRPENVDPLRQNSTVIFLRRDIEQLPTHGRPLSQANDLNELYRRRRPLYEEAKDIMVDNVHVTHAVSEIIRKAVAMKLLVINGPNLNMLGIREPDIYGKENYPALTSLVEQTCDQLDIKAEIFQSNHEGAIVDRIQEAYGTMDAIVINPAAYAHTSIAIMDALKAVSLPAVEVHLSDTSAREEFRRISYTGMACEKSFIGMGFRGYVEAITYLKKKYG
jgi:shikimate dehydrogenase